MRSDLTDPDTKVGTADEFPKIGGLSEREQLVRRQTLRVALAVFLIWIAVTSTSTAGQIDLAAPCTASCTQSASSTGSSIQLDGFTPVPITDDVRVVPGNLQAAYAQLYAELFSFDRDADADGWHASVVIESRDGSVVIVPARATFEIFEHAQRYDRHPTRTSLIRSRPLARWSVPLRFDEQGVAAVTLPASSSVQRLLGWSSEATIHTGIRIAASHRQVRWRYLGNVDDHRHFVTQNLRDRIDFPSAGWMRVRLTIPGQQSLTAIAPIDTRPAVLVDIPRRYR